MTGGEVTRETEALRHMPGSVASAMPLCRWVLVLGTVVKFHIGQSHHSHHQYRLYVTI